jgi:uncharacterized damage-inducible protein DinB
MLKSLFAHMRWADDRARGALAQLSPSTPEYERALSLYAHIAAAEHIWLARLDGRTPAYPVWPSISPDEAAHLAAESAKGLAEHAARCDETDHDAAVVYTTSAGQAQRTGLREILLHVALHGSYHRGQLASAIRAGGATPAATDYIVFAREMTASFT